MYIIFYNAAVVGDGAVKLGVGSLTRGSLVDKAVVGGAFACGVDIVSVSTTCWIRCRIACRRGVFLTYDI